LFVFLAQQTEGEDKIKLFSSLVSVIAADHSDHSLLRLKFLNNIFNAEQDSKIRLNTFLNICCLSLSTNNTSLLVPHLSKIPVWVKAWGLDGADTRRVYKAMAACMKSSETPVKYYEFLIQMLGSLEEEDVEEEAVEAVRLALKLVEVRDFDEIIDLKGVKQLSQGEKAPLVKLLDIFAKGTMGDFNAFAQDAFFSTYDLDKSELVAKMRYIAIAAMGSVKKTLTFSELVKELGVEEEEVELWVLDAIEKDYVKAKIDELAGVVNIRQAHLRLFGEGEWKQLQGDFTRAEKNLNQVLNNIEKSFSSVP